MQIERKYPIKKYEKNYPERFSKLDFELFNKLNIKELQNNYKKLKDGINYKTNRKIKIGGRVYDRVKYDFFFNSSCKSVFFEDLININQDQYLIETEKIKNKIDAENAEIQNYNIMVDDVIDKIQKLEKWDNFIEFESKKYGLQNILNDIHRENNCMGNMVFHKKTEHECRGCRDGMPFNSTYECNCYFIIENICDKCGIIV